jgi:hypothetical protein
MFNSRRLEFLTSLAGRRVEPTPPLPRASNVNHAMARFRIELARITATETAIVSLPLL